MPKSPHPVKQMQAPPSFADAVFSMVDGEQLPGPLGLVQQLLSVWTTGWPMPGANNFQWAAWTAKSILQSASLVRKFQRDQDIYRTQKKFDLIRAYMEHMELEFPESSGFLTNLIYEHASLMQVEQATLAADTEHLIKWFTTPDGQRFCYIFYDTGNDTEKVELNTQYLGPLMRKDDMAQALDSISRFIWQSKGGEDLQLTLTDEVNNPNSGVSLSSIGKPAPFLRMSKQSWSDVEGLAARYLAFQSKGFRRRVLFHGPAGCGKTSLCRTLARTITSGRTLRIGPEVMVTAELQRLLAIVSFLSPRVLLLDDIDRCGRNSSRFLHALEDFSAQGAHSMIVMATANVPKAIDPALLRTGRFDEVHFVDLPDEEHRKHLLSHFCQEMDFNYDTAQLCERTVDWAPSDLRELIKRLSVLGSEFLEIEIDSVNMQRKLYSGDAMTNYLLERGNLSDDYDD